MPAPPNAYLQQPERVNAEIVLLRRRSSQRPSARVSVQPTIGEAFRRQLAANDDNDAVSSASASVELTDAADLPTDGRQSVEPLEESADSQVDCGQSSEVRAPESSTANRPAVKGAKQEAIQQRLNCLLAEKYELEQAKTDALRRQVSKSENCFFKPIFNWISSKWKLFV